MLNQQPDQHVQLTEPREIFPAFPAPRVWHLGWAGDAWAGTIHSDSTADFMATSIDGDIIDAEEPARQ